MRGTTNEMESITEAALHIKFQASAINSVFIFRGNYKKLTIFIVQQKETSPKKVGAKPREPDMYIYAVGTAQYYVCM